MKASHIALWSWSTALILGMASCGSMHNFVQSGSEQNNGSNKKHSHRDVLPQDRQQFILDKAAATYTPDELGRGVIKGDWAVEEVFGKPAIGLEDAPYIKFDLTSHKVYINNGCNYLSGTYNYSSSDKSLRFSELFGTMRLCDSSVITESEINQALDAVRFYSWELRDSQYYLFLENSNHEIILTLMHQSFDFLNGTWIVKAIDDQAVAIPDLRFVIDVDEHKIHGNTGCNTLNGKLITEMDAPNSISFQALAITQRHCPDVDYENDLIVALEDAASVKPISPDKVLLINNHGVVVLELERAK